MCGASLLSDGDGGADAHFREDDGGRGAVGADASVGGEAAVDVSGVHADAGAGEAHPVGHAGSEEFSSGGDFVFS